MKLTTRIKGYIDSAKLTYFPLLASLSLTSESSLRVTLSRLVKAGEIYNPVKGTYVSKNADLFRVACQLHQGYISLSTAFYLHNLIEEFPFTVFVASNVRKTVQIGNLEFVYFKARNYSGVEKGDYPIASIEKAISDSLMHLPLTSFTMLAKVLYYANIDSSKLIQLCDGGSSALFQRLGYLLSLLPKLDKEKSKVLRFCSKKIKTTAYLNGRRRGTYVAEWKIIDNLGKEAIMSWWQQ
ncbi:MAG: hypothetical protein KGH77_02620 [Candidatus Micrarchaeota archaeon]|nr:hypothetical protein [Candidatus Micrarchaeota archaeon]MDE1864296.1 hypothetical protein [Candidatus Micrarchaeota archaeon]